MDEDEAAARGVIAGRTLQGWLDRADALGAAGRYFEAHEELEAGWKAAEDPEKTLLQGVIQIAAGLHRLALDAKRRAGSDYLLDRGLAKLRKSRALLAPDSLAALEAALAGVRAAGEAPPGMRFGLRAPAGRRLGPKRVGNSRRRESWPGRRT